MTWTQLLSLPDSLSHICSQTLAFSWNGPGLVIKLQSPLSPWSVSLYLGIGPTCIMASSVPSPDCSHGGAGFRRRRPEGPGDTKK